jgi:mRNA-degrading endonuclease RelE of RelBE toxin-antitoxin system
MKDFKFSKTFIKNTKKLSKFEKNNISKKIKQILSSDINYYKNLRYNLQNLKRVHINGHFVILFYENEGVIYFDNYLHHDNAYK